MRAGSMSSDQELQAQIIPQLPHPDLLHKNSALIAA